MGEASLFYTSLVLLPLLALTLPVPASAQFIDRPYDEQGTSSFGDPLRRTLGLWARLLNRMADTSPPSDDQLRLKEQMGGSENPLAGTLSSASAAMKDAYEKMNANLKQIAAMPNLIMGRGGNARNAADPASDFFTPSPKVVTTPRPSLTTTAVRRISSKIIDEQKLLQLLPRVREDPHAEATTSENATPTMAAEISTKASTSETTTPMSSTTSNPPAKGKGSRRKHGKKARSENRATEAAPEPTTLASTPDTSKASSIASLEKPTESGVEHQQRSSHTSQAPSTGTRAATGDHDSGSRKHSNSTISKEESQHGNDNSTGILTMENETAELIAEIENVLKEEQWILQNRRSSNATASESGIQPHAQTNSTFNPPDTSKDERGSPSGNKTKEIAGPTESESASESSESGSEGDEEGSSEENRSSGEHEEGEEESENNDDVVADQTQPASLPSSTTTPVPTTTTASSTATSTTIASAKPEATTTTSKKRQNVKNSIAGKANKKVKTTTEVPTTNVTIPEAEDDEAERKPGKANEAYLAHNDSSIAVKKEPSSEDRISNPTLTDFYGDRQLAASMIRPVNRIIDGIGPLILPLLGYSREAFTSYNPRPRTQGVGLYRPDYDYYQKSNPSADHDQNGMGGRARYALQQGLGKAMPPRQYAALKQAGHSSVRSNIPAGAASQGRQVLPPQVTVSPIVYKQIMASRLKKQKQQKHLQEQQNQSQQRKHPPEYNNNNNNNVPFGKQGGVDTAPHARFMPDPPIHPSHQLGAEMSGHGQEQQVATPSRQEPSPSPHHHQARPPLFTPEALRQVVDDTLLMQRRAQSQSMGARGRFQEARQLQQIAGHAAAQPMEELGSGLETGRGQVQKAFLENSGINLGREKGEKPIQPDTAAFTGKAAKPISKGVVGFGGGRQPDSSFDEAAAINTSPSGFH